MKRKLIIQLGEDDADDEIITERVLELLSEGYICGTEPFWEIREEKEPEVLTIKEILQKIGSVAENHTSAELEDLRYMFQFVNK